MKTKNEIEKKLEKTMTKYLADTLPPMTEENKRTLDYDKGYFEALKWVLEDKKTGAQIVTTSVIEAVKLALEQISQDYVRLSQKIYSQIEGDRSFKLKCSKEKILERPFAYEFYHQFRKLMEEKIVDFGELVIQAEIDKTYQHCSQNDQEGKISSRGKIPDFLIHLPNRKDDNLAVIEFKLTSNLSNLESDFKKLVKFKLNPHLKYNYGIEVIIGDTKSLEQAKAKTKRFATTKGEELNIIYFDTQTLKASNSSIKLKI